MFQARYSLHFHTFTIPSWWFLLGNDGERPILRRLLLRCHLYQCSLYRFLFQDFLLHEKTGQHEKKTDRQHFWELCMQEAWHIGKLFTKKSLWTLWCKRKKNDVDACNAAHCRVRGLGTLKTFRPVVLSRPHTNSSCEKYFFCGQESSPHAHAPLHSCWRLAVLNKTIFN